ncbi:MAG TPA: hypothetical protein VMM17_07600 [Gemmatimonadaceae bacterium]|nr:hypothetical protein [Gemmatimonadaceae bacterium]
MRTQNAVYTLPRGWSSLAQVLTPLVERIDPLNAATQLLIVTPDVESTVGLVAGAFTRFGVQGIDVLPATGAARAGRLLKSDPARAVAGPPWVLRELLAASALRLDDLRSILLAWVDDLVEEPGEGLTDLETVLSEAPRDATRTLVVRGLTGPVEKFIERHMHQARRIGTVGSATESRLALSYVTTSAAARPAALRQVLDETDPPSAVVLVLSDDSEAEARAAVHRLGYRRADDVVRVSRGEVAPNTHTVILYDLPVDAEPLEAVNRAKPARVVALLEARELDTLRRLTGGRATPLERSDLNLRARRADELLRRDIRLLLESGHGLREVGAIEPLLGEYDGAEIAGALIRMLERERERNARSEKAASTRAPERRDRAVAGSGSGEQRRDFVRGNPRDTADRSRPREGGAYSRPREGAERARPREDRGFDRGRGESRPGGGRPDRAERRPDSRGRAARDERGGRRPDTKGGRGR